MMTGQRWGRRFPLPILALLLLLVAIASAQTSTKPISKKGLIDALHIGGLSNGELVQLVRQRGVNFVLTPEVERELRQAHASPELIEAVQANNRSAVVPPTVAPEVRPAIIPPITPPAPVYPQTPGIYVSKGGHWTPLIAEGFTWKHEGIFKKFGTAAIGKGSFKGEIPGNRTPTNVSDPATFLIYTQSGANVTEYVLLRLHRKGDSREFKVPAESALHPRGDKQDVVPFSSHRVADRTFSVTFSEGAGDYGFLLPGATVGEMERGKILSFRVE